MHTALAGGVHHIQLAQGMCYERRKLPNRLTVPKSFGGFRPETLDHAAAYGTRNPKKVVSVAPAARVRGISLSKEMAQIDQITTLALRATSHL